STLSVQVIEPLSIVVHVFRKPDERVVLASGVVGVNHSTICVDASRAQACCECGSDLRNEVQVDDVGGAVARRLRVCHVVQRQNGERNERRPTNVCVCVCETCIPAP